MQQDRFDVIVVGAGPAGSAAAYQLATAGKKVLLIERGKYAGSKNMMGGRIYTHALEQLIPNFRDRAPLEREVRKEQISILDGEEATTFTYQHSGHSPEESSYIVLRAKFDRWLQQEAEQAGALVVNCIEVTDVIQDEEHRIIGVRCDEDEVYADLVIIAEGANSLLAEKAGLRKRPDLGHMAVGVKEVYKLSKESINERFGLNDGEGCAWLSLGDMTDGLMGGGFVYTNAANLSVGVVVGLEKLGTTATSIDDMLTTFTTSPPIQAMIRGGKLLERSAHMVPEGTYDSMPTLGGAGYALVGDTAGLCINLGYTVRGMDFAIASGRLAAEAYLEAVERESLGIFSKIYEEKINQSFVGHDMKLYRHFGDFLNRSNRVFQVYPRFVNDVMHDVFRVDGQGATPIIKKLFKQVKQIGVLNLGIDAWKGGRSL